MRRRDVGPPSTSRPELKPRLPTPRAVVVRCVILAAVLIVGVYFSTGALRQPAEGKRPAPDESESIPAPKHEAVPKPPHLVDLNTAKLEDLLGIPDMRENVALAIIRMRPFEKLEDLLRVPGIKEKRLELMRPYLTLTKAP